MNLLSKLNSNVKPKTIEPREIFMTLPSKAAGYGYPRDVQSEVWKKWFDIRNEKNVILKMNTGSGKTVVGLIMLQSCLNEEKGPAIYVVPDNYLVKQVIDEAKKLGISVTEDKNDYNYSNSKAILVTSIQTIVNGYSYFGMREGGNYPIGSIIIDDVHACMDKIIGQFMIKIDSETDAYKELIAIFSSSLKDYNPKDYIDIVEIKDYQKRMLVPYWEWQRQQENIYRILMKYNDKKNASIYFGLPLIERCLETCDCIITSSAIEISPKGIDLDKISSLEEASRRIYMSATLADDSVFVSALGLTIEDMKNIITPENANDIGDRLVIFPKYVNSDISEIEVKEKVEEIAKKYNVVILVPSFSRAKFWDENGKRTAKKDNIDKIVEILKSGRHVGKVIFVNRYDGIDLPGDACRMLVIDGLPPLNSIKDRYIQSVAPQSTTLLREQVQRIEQGMGRGVRSNDDECCVVLMGDELTDVLSRNKGIPLVPFVKERLLALKEEQEENRRLCGRSYIKEYLGYVCVNEIGDLIKPSYVTRSFSKLLQANGFRHIRFHDLRHSCASLLLKNGVPMKQIQEWLGHSDFSTTANIYAHLDCSSKLISADAMLNGLGMDSK